MSISTDPSTTIRPLSGRTNPAITLMIEGLACSRAAKQCGETAPAAEMDVELEGAEPVLDIDLEHRAHSGSRRALPKTAASRLGRTASMWSGVKPGLTIAKTYNFEARAGVGAGSKNGVGWPGVISCSGWFRLRGGDNEGQN